MAVIYCAHPYLTSRTKYFSLVAPPIFVSVFYSMYSAYFVDQKTINIFNP